MPKLIANLIVPMKTAIKLSDNPIMALLRALSFFSITTPMNATMTAIVPMLSISQFTHPRQGTRPMSIKHIVTIPRTIPVIGKGLFDDDGAPEN